MNTDRAVGGVPVSPFDSLAACAQRILADVHSGKGGFAIAINAEKVVTCNSDRNVQETIERATLRYPDGAGVVVAMRLKGVRSTRVAGADLWLEVLRQARGQNLSIALLGAKPEVLDATRRRIEADFPEITVSIARNGYDGMRDLDALAQELAARKPDLVFVALGSPKQELLIERLRLVHPAAAYGDGSPVAVAVLSHRRSIGRTRRNRCLPRRNAAVLRQPSRMDTHGLFVCLARADWLLSAQRTARRLQGSREQVYASRRSAPTADR